MNVLREVRINGKLAGVVLQDGIGEIVICPGGRAWTEVLDWNDAQPPDKKLDLSDKEPEPPADDPDRRALKVLKAKAIAGTIDAADVKQAVVLLLKREG